MISSSPPRVVLLVLGALLTCSCAPSEPTTLDAHQANALTGSLIQVETLSTKDLLSLGVTPPHAARTSKAVPIVMDEDTHGALQEIYTDPGDLPQLRINIQGKAYDLPLKHTDVQANITGSIARVDVTQTYINTLPAPIEAVYTFPLPENSAVHDLKIILEDRIIASEIQTRSQAKVTYDAAKKQGYTAALVEQERPNIFTQSVANIPPKTSIDVRVSYVQDLTYDNGSYEFVFPMVVGPRFIPGDPTGNAPRGSGWSQDTSEVADASRITPALVGGGMRTGRDISLRVDVDAGFPIRNPSTPTHAVQRTTLSETQSRFTLNPADSLPNRDFVLRYTTASPTPQATLLVEEHEDDDKSAHFTLIAQPPDTDVDANVGRREFILTVDVSGSMRGTPLSMAKIAAKDLLRKLRPVDTFNIVTFAGRSVRSFETSRPANTSNIRKGLQIIDGLSAGGGTYMAEGLQTALEDKQNDERHRYVILFTDGYVGNEDAIAKQTATYLQSFDSSKVRARVFAVGIGSSVNRHLLDVVTKAGKGLAITPADLGETYRAVNSITAAVDHPILNDVSIDWGNLDATELQPAVFPSLFATRPMTIHGILKDTDDLSDNMNITLRGTRDGKPISIPIRIQRNTNPFKAKDPTPILAKLWARSKIDLLTQATWLDTSKTKAIEKEITSLGLEHRLVTQYTSLIAVDRSRKVQGDSTTILQPSDAPEGVAVNATPPPSVKVKRRPRPMPAPPAQNLPAHGDHDGDGIPNAQDRCPNTPGLPHTGGCPQKRLVSISSDEIRILSKVFFNTRSAKISKKSYSLLNEIAKVLKQNPNIQKIEIQGHTSNADGRNPKMLLKLSEKRANAVRDYLISKGVSADRLTIKGYGSTQPIRPTKGLRGKALKEAHANNMRVEFKITQSK